MYDLVIKNEKAVFSDGMTGMRFTVPAEDCMGMVQTNPIAPITCEAELKKAFSEPVSGMRLSELVRARKSKTACVLISDATRGIPTAPLASLTVKELVLGGMALEDIHFFVAIGVHRDATEEEMKLFLALFCVNG